MKPNPQSAIRDPQSTPGPTARDLGTPVRGVSWARLHPGRTADGRASLLASMSQNNGGMFVIDIDLETGHCRQFAAQDPVNSTFSAATYRSLRSGILYIASGWNGHFHRFDANHSERGLEDLGKYDPAANAPCGIGESPDGTLWIGTYPNARLIRFDPATATFTPLGPMDGTDNYIYPLGGDDGTVAGIVKFIRPHLVVIDPRTNEHREVGPCVTDPTDKAQFLKFFKGTDRRLYLDSHAGKFRVDGMNLTPVDELPPVLPGIPATYRHGYQAPAEMPGGWTAHFLDDNINGTGTPRNVLLANTNPMVPSRRLHLDWVGGGSNIHIIDPGPDGQLYGSSYMPNLLYRSSLDGREMVDLGQHTFAMGEAYSMAVLDGKIYLGSYPEARLSVYDPAKPVHFGTGPNDNPRDLGRPDPIGLRPNALIATPDGRLWMGASPDYGLVGGSLTWYDPRTGERKSHRAILPETTPASMLYLPELRQILVGLSVEAGTGVTIKRLDGAFALWDPARDELAWSGDFGLPDLADVTSLVPDGHGRVYALIGRGDHILSAGPPEVRPRLALIDPAKRTLVASAYLPEDFGPLSWHGLFSLRTGPGGAIYGATGYCIFRIKPGTCEVERLWQKVYKAKRDTLVWINSAHPDVIDVVGPIIGREFYFATGWRLRAVTLP
ncbi:MAG TPA: hypothetical protein PLU52_02950 [Opitutaceae bacterium]|nr:hypothetical protein [Opitutaceae bacterium]HND60829.1 hypothetical protein [Opitutaceae bacterium]